MNHPTPWRVEYFQRFAEWHEHSSPQIVDADGIIVVMMPQSAECHHPGFYDREADELAKRIVAAVNKAGDA